MQEEGKKSVQSSRSRTQGPSLRSSSACMHDTSAGRVVADGPAEEKVGGISASATANASTR